MKPNLKALVVILTPVLAQSQSIERQVYVSSGNFVENSIGSLSYTIGEPVIVLGTDGSKSLLQGF